MGPSMGALLAANYLCRQVIRKKKGFVNHFIEFTN
jgi:predicted patatin/cPLA2 family phospholipase